MLGMGRWEARGGSRAGPGLERKSDPSPGWDLPLAFRLESYGRLSLEVGRTNHLRDVGCADC